jgi:sugar phosphate isomerase/epimerase
MKEFTVLHIELNSHHLNEKDSIAELKKLFENSQFEVSTLQTSTGLIIDFPFDEDGFTDTRVNL